MRPFLLINRPSRTFVESQAFAELCAFYSPFSRIMHYERAALLSGLRHDVRTEIIAQTLAEYNRAAKAPKIANPLQ